MNATRALRTGLIEGSGHANPPRVVPTAFGRIPRATYRLQLQPGFGFAEVTALRAYLEEIGISDVYTSPILAPRAGSTHGYDVVDHTRINPELGSRESLEELGDQLRAHHMGLIVDVVPNHMCVATHLNRWWSDVLENGPASCFARFFDIDWRPPKPDLRDRVLLPILGDQYGRILEAAQLAVQYANGAFWLHYFDWKLPLAPKSWTHILAPATAALRARLADDGSQAGLDALESILVAIRNLPSRTDLDPEHVRERIREKEIIKRRLLSLLDESEMVRSAVFTSITTLNGKKGDPSSFDALDQILREQAHRVAFWRVASDEINYRRFFDINELAALRVEEPTVFDAVHQVLFDLIREGRITGLRIDHVDGLLDPLGYLQTLAERCRASRHDVEGKVEFRPDEHGIYLIVEKILAEGEHLPADWPVHGTTGYDFLNLVGGLFIDPEGTRTLLQLYRTATASTAPFTDVAYDCKKLVLERAMSSEIAMLARRLDRISEQHRHSRDFTLRDLTDALVEVIACLPVYRTYVRPGAPEVGPEDRKIIARAVWNARRRNPEMPSSLFDFVRSVLMVERPEGLDDTQIEQRIAFTLRLQQLTGGVTAKALEDTAFYRFYPLASRTEVGGTPERPAVSAADFHRANALRLQSHPHTMLATSTHDTKRGEDVRARIRVLSEVPEDWGRAFLRFRQLNERFRVIVDEDEAPDANEEYLLYQTLVGAWPFESDLTSGPLKPRSRANTDAATDQFRARIKAYMQKALREAKVHTSWVNPNELWEEAVLQFVDSILRPDEDNTFLAELREFQRPLAKIAVYGALSQLLLKICVPGVPDFYQGSELWDLSLVDPDNRGRVDFERRRAVLHFLRTEAEKDARALVTQLLSEPETGAIKMYVMLRALGLRKKRPELFAFGAYQPLIISGSRQEHAVAFARIHENTGMLVVVGRRFAALGGAETAPIGEEVWGNTCVEIGEMDGRTNQHAESTFPLATSRFRDVFTGIQIEAPGATLSLARAFAHLPIALFEIQS